VAVRVQLLSGSVVSLPAVDVSTSIADLKRVVRALGGESKEAVRWSARARSAYPHTLPPMTSALCAVL
jgi:hypothetical protein